MFLFAVGYGVGPQFVRGVAKDGVPQAIFAAVQCVFCLLVPVAIAKFVGYDLGYAAGFYSVPRPFPRRWAYPQTPSTDWAWPPMRPETADSMPVAYAVTYISAPSVRPSSLRSSGPALLAWTSSRLQGIRRKERRQQGLGGRRSAWHRWEIRALPRAAGREGRWSSGNRGRALVPDARVFV